jgi:hypothetical protein
MGLLSHQSTVAEPILHLPLVRDSLALAHFAILASFGISLLAINPTPLDAMGYFSYELLVPIICWFLLVGSIATSVLMIESDHALAFPAIVGVVLAARAPLFLMFKLPYNPDSYFYMNIIRYWHQSGVINLTVDVRAQYWPVSYLLLYGFREIGISELTLWSAGTLTLYAVNALLAYLLLRTYVSEKASRYALLLIAVAPTFNFYFYTIMAPQLIASTFFLGGLLALSAYERQQRKRHLLLSVGLFVVLLFTHHLTALLLAGYALILAVEKPFARLLEFAGIKSAETVSPRWHWWKPFVLGIGMMSAFVGFLATIAQGFFTRYFPIMLAVLTGRSSTYADVPAQGSTQTVSGASAGASAQGIYTISNYTFSFDSIYVYGFRLMPLLIGSVIFFSLWAWQLKNKSQDHSLSPEDIRSTVLTATLGVLIIFSLIVLKGLFLEVSRLWDMSVLFASAVLGSWFVRPQAKKRAHFAKVWIVLSLLVITSVVGIAVQTSEYVYYQDERQAVLFSATHCGGSVLYTDERLFPFAMYWAPGLVVRLIPPNLLTMTEAQSQQVIVLISSHSILYDQYRSLFGHPPGEVAQFVENRGVLIFEQNGVYIYRIV